MPKESLPTSIKRLKRLHQKKTRLEKGLFLVEGPLCVEELLAHTPERAQALYIDQENAGFQDIEKRAEELGLATHFVEGAQIHELSDTVTPQGVVAVAKTVTVSLEEAMKNARLIAVMHEVRDPGNAGTVLRAADAAGADAVIFAGSCIDPFNSKVVRSTTGSIFHLPIVTGVTLEEVVAAAKEHGLSLLAADVKGEKLSPQADMLTKPHGWVFGNEANGLSDDNLALLDASFRLPIFGKAESLNLATAASVCLYLSAFAIQY